MSGDALTSQQIQRLKQWYSSRLNLDGVEISGVSRPGSGVVNDTLCYWIRSGSLGEDRVGHVLRLQPSGCTPIAHVNVLEQAQTLRALSGTEGVPTPAVIAHEENPRWLGRPFFVMERLPGLPIFDLNRQPESPAELAKLFDAAITALARIHAIDWTTPGFAHLGARIGTNPLREQIANYRSIYENSRGSRHYALIEEALAWLEANAPDNLPLVLNWGDARIGNILFDAGQLTAVLDWEIAEIAPREADLGWFLFFERFYWPDGEQGRPGGPTRDHLISTYRSASGVSVGDLDFFERWAALRLAIMRMRAGRIAIKSGTVEAAERPDEVNYSTEQLVRLFHREGRDGRR